jgi:hypothetical protein
VKVPCLFVVVTLGFFLINTKSFIPTISLLYLILSNLPLLLISEPENLLPTNPPFASAQEPGFKDCILFRKIGSGLD